MNDFNEFEEEAKAEERTTFLLIILFILMSYIGVAWFTFIIRHPNAGQGAFFVNFIEVIKFEKVEDYE